MAILTLEPKIRVCFKNNCGTIDIYDTTGAYNATSNTGGWGATNITTVDVDSVTVSHTPPGGDATTTDVTTTVNAEVTVTGEFLIASLDVTATDGEHTFVYTATEGTDTVTYTLRIFSTCVVRCCVDKLWAKAAQELESGDCGCSGGNISYGQKAMKAEALYQSIRNYASSSIGSTRDSLLAKLQRICNLENCNCN